jgi:hypothetical protein
MVGPAVAITWRTVTPVIAIGDPDPMRPFIRTVASPITAEMLEPLDPRCQVVQFSADLQEREYVQLARFIADYPSVKLRAWGGVSSLDFLQHFRAARRFQADLWNLDSWDGLQYLPPELESLTLGRTKKSLSLRILQRFSNLTQLFLEGHVKDISVLSDLTSIQDLTLRSITLSDLSVLLGMKRLWSLDLKLGGTKDLRLLPQLESLKHLELWMVRGLDNLDPIASLGNLQFLTLQALRQVEALPAFDSLTKLRRVILETMKGLRDIRPLASAPSLEELLVIDMGHMQPDDFRPLVGRRHLRYVSIGLGSRKKNEAVASLFPNAEHGELPEFQFR